MDFNDLLDRQGIDPARVLVLRHRPSEPSLQRILPWIVAEHPALFDAYQSYQTPRVENTMIKLEGGWVGSFLGESPGTALFVGLYRIGQSEEQTRQVFSAVPENLRLRQFGMRDHLRESVRRFDLALQKDFYSEWIGRLVIGWTPPDRSWWRRAHKNKLPVLAIHQESALASAMPSWDQIVLSWREMRAIPQAWRSALSHWRGVYYIFDTARQKGYVGSAYGEDNLLGRWENYAKTGHGGNVLLKTSNPDALVFTILQRVSPDMALDQVIRLESSWKTRLHTRNPHGLNSN